MPRQTAHLDSQTPRPFHVLVVDPDPGFTDVIQRVAQDGQPMQVAQATCIADAQKYLDAHRVDVAVIEPTLPDGSGLDLAEQLSASKKITQTIVSTTTPDVDAAIAAMRAGVSDFIVKPIDLHEISNRIHAAFERQTRDKQRAGRVRRLRRLCKKLNQARVDVSQQVDILCNDLVTAYQELAVQMQQSQTGVGYAELIDSELDLEPLLRKTLEHLMEQAGPTNAAIFLPANLDEYSLGGYVNYDCTAESADMLLEHLADVLAPRVSEASELVHVTDNHTLTDWLGDDAAYLADSHLLAFACRSDGETLAVITLFRDQNEPFDLNLLERCDALAPLLGDALARVIKVHHRHLPDMDDENEFDLPFG